MKKYMLSAALSCLMLGFVTKADAAKGTVNTNNSTTADITHAAPQSQSSIPAGLCDTTAYCFQKEQCNDTNCQNAIVACHMLSETKFNTMVASYSVPPMCLGSYSAGYFRSLISSMNCTANDHISFTDVSGSIVFSVVTGTPYSSGTGRYSVAFFAGVLRQYAPSNNDMFVFYRVKDAFGNQSVGMKLLIGNSEVFYSDMTEVYP